MPRLRDLIQERAALGPDELLGCIRREIHEFTQADEYEDDLTIVVVRVGSPATEFQVRRAARSFPASMDQLEAVRGFVKKFCRNSCAETDMLDAETLFVTRLQLAVQEVITNIIRHGVVQTGDAEVQLEAEAYSDRVVVLISHKGQTYHPDRIARPDLGQYPEGGFGLFLMANTVDALIYPDREEGVSCIGLVKFLPQ